MQCRSHLIAAIFGAAIMLCTACGAMRSRPMAGAEFWGFTAPWDPRSAATVAAHQGALDAVVSGFITLDSVSFRPVQLFRDPVAGHNPGNGRLMALLTSYHGTRFHPETIRALAEDSTALGQVAGAVAEMVGGGGYRGLILDFEGLTPYDLDALVRVSKGMADSARAHGVSPIGIAVPATDTASYPGRPLLSAVDFLVVMLYDQHWLTSPPGPIASPEWAARALGSRLGDVGTSRIVAALPVYGYQWRSDSATGVVSFDQAQQLARSEHVALVRDPASATLHAEARTWSLWTSDAVLLEALVLGARRAGVTKFALWRLGLEDPRIWTGVVH